MFLFYLSTNPDLAPYQHTPEQDDTCKVFHPNGGGASYLAPPSGINDGSNWTFVARNAIPNIPNPGSISLELMMILPNVTEQACIETNKHLGHGSNALFDPDSFDVYTYFTGTYGPTTFMTWGGYITGCVISNTNGNAEGSIAGNYYIFHVLIAR